MRLVFCGTPEFAVPTLDALLRAGHSIELVLTQPDRPSGRGMEVQPSAVKQFAQNRGLTVRQPDKVRNNPELQEKLEELTPDCIVVVAYGRIIPPWMLALPQFGNLNAHASLLPKYRGAAPIQWSIANGETETGVTVMRIDEGLDTGDILAQTRVEISPSQTSPELAHVLANASAELMVKTLTALENGTAKAVPQDNASATLAPILQREDGRVDWTRTAREIFNRWRGFQPWPGAFTSFRGKKLSLRGMGVEQHPTDAIRSHSPGTLTRSGDGLLVICGEKTVLRLDEVQLEGKRQIAVKDFLNGIPLQPGERLG